METSFYSEYIDHEFENCTFKIIKQYHNYLTRLYGDYLKLPPKEQQVTHHSFDVYYKKDLYKEPGNDLH